MEANLNENKLASLEHLISPITTEVFIKEYWESKVLLIQRKNPKFWMGLLSIKMIDDAISTLNLRYGEIKLTKYKTELDKENYLFKNDLVNVQKVFQYYSEGHTIVLNALNYKIRSLCELVTGMERDFSMPFQTNIYLTPPHSQGFDAHYDQHCVFVLQVEGTKKWRIGGKPVTNPTNEYAPEIDIDPESPITMEFELEPGDMLYIPRGVVHSAYAQEGPSLHVTLGALAYNWSHLFSSALEYMHMIDPDFRRSLPTGFAKPGFDTSSLLGLFRKFVKKLDNESALDSALKSQIDTFTNSRRPLMHGQLFQFRKVTEIDYQKKISPRPFIIYHATETADLYYVIAYQNQITFPINLKEAVVFALENKEYRLEDLPGGMDLQSKRLIIQRLVHFGLVCYND